jgi:hypothetical protein
MQFYMWKKNQRLQSVVERHRPSDSAANPLPMGKALLAIARLYEFPTRVIDTLPDEEERKKVETVLSYLMKNNLKHLSRPPPSSAMNPLSNKSPFLVKNCEGLLYLHPLLSKLMHLSTICVSFV